MTGSFPTLRLRDLAVLFSALVAPCQAAYGLRRTYNHTNFESSFGFRQASDYPGTGDPTHGFVNYLPVEKAKEQSLFRITDSNQVYIGSDNTTYYATTDQGRGSLRLESLDTFEGGLLIADIAHMPGNVCGVWPAFWMYNFKENPISEIDIIEGVSNLPNNAFSLHTCDACQFNWPSQATRRHVHGVHGHARHLAHKELARSSSTDTAAEVATYMTGTELRADCILGGDTCGGGANTYAGCGATSTTGYSYGDGFNSPGGGVYAIQMETNDSGTSFIKIWNFPRNDIPADITSGSPDPDTWSLPIGAFLQSHGSCDMKTIFHDMTIIINTDFCGSNVDDGVWFGDSKCAKYPSCKDFVAQNPDQFSETYWLFNSIKIYS